jgi:hypothetical protein
MDLRGFSVENNYCKNDFTLLKNKKALQKEKVKIIFKKSAKRQNFLGQRLL